MTFRILCSVLALAFIDARVEGAVVAPLHLRADGFVEGAFAVHADWKGSGGVVVESSSDLRSWKYEWLLPSGDGMPPFRDKHAQAALKFYRARDYVVEFKGTVRDIETKDGNYAPY